MVHRPKKKAHSTRRGVDADEVVSGRVVISFTSTSGTSSGTYVNPAFTDYAGSQVVAGGVKLSTLASCFQYFRFTRMRWRLIPSATNAQQISAYTPDAIVTVPNYSGIVGMPVTSDLVVVNASEVQSPATQAKVSVPRGVLLDQNVKWWRTTAIGSPVTPQDLDYQGSLWVGTSVAFSTQTMYIDLEYTCEFRDFIAPADLPLVPRIVSSCTRDDGKEESDAEEVKVPDNWSDICPAESSVLPAPDQALDVVEQGPTSAPPAVGRYIVGFKSRMLAEAKALAVAQRISVSAAKRLMGLT